MEKRMIPIAAATALLLTMSVEAAEGPRQNPWQKKMQQLSQLLTEILVDVSSDSRFKDPANKSRLDSNARRLAALAGELKTAGEAPQDKDPTLRMLAGGFQADASRAYAALKSGNREYAREVLSGISSYCVSCHTRNDSGPSFKPMALSEAAKKLRPLERAKFLAATRQFDLALTEFEIEVSDPALVRERPLDSTLAARYGLAIAIRVKKDPDRGIALLDRLLANTETPFFLREYAVQWKAELQHWKEELPRLPTTAEGLYSEAVRLTTAAREQQKFPADRSADVLYLRASSAVHDLLQAAPEGEHAAQAFLMAGMCYEVLRDLSLDDLHEAYFESCVRKSPGSELSQLCFRRYEQSVLQGFTGTSGTHLPSDVRARLAELQKIATTPSSTLVAPAPVAPPR